MYRYLLLFILSLSTYVSRAQSFGNLQSMRIDYTSACDENLRFCRDCADTAAVFKTNLQKYVSKEINWRKLETVAGIIIIDLSVDTLGKPCCMSIINRTANTDFEIVDLWLGQLIDHMPRWTPAIKNGKPINTITSIAIYLNVEEHKDFEVHYLRANDFKRIMPLKINPKSGKATGFYWDEKSNDK